MSVAIIGGAIGGVGVQYPLASGACVVQGTTLVDVPFKHLDGNSISCATGE